MRHSAWIFIACGLAAGCSFDREAAVPTESGAPDSGPARDATGPDGPIERVEIRINLNGNEHVGIDYPGTWSADPGNTCDGNLYTEARDLRNTNDQELFQTVYFGAFRCEIGDALPAGTYEVTLLMGEITRGDFCFGDQDQRIFNVDIEGDRVLSDFDLLAASDGCLAAFANNDSHPVVQTFDVDINDGSLTIEYTGEDNALAQAVQLIRKN